MGITTKIFIVLNLVIAVFVGAAGFVVYGKQLYWVEQTKLAVDAGSAMYAKLTGEIQNLTAELAALNVKADQSASEVLVLRNDKENLGKENSLQAQTIEEKSSNINNLNDTLKQLNTIIEQKERRNVEIQAKLDVEANARRLAERAAEYHQAQAIEAAAELREAENEMLQLAKSNSELVRRVALVTNQIEKYVERYGAESAAGTPTDVAISGRVMKVESSLDIVILSVGEKDKVAKGMEFVISRGDNYIAKVRVANVYENMCSARIVSGMTKQGETIQVADTASTL